MPTASMIELLEAGVHFGHQTQRWNPKMKRFIFTERNGIYIIDLQKTVKKLDEAYAFVRDVAANGGEVLFVGTKKQAADSIKEECTEKDLDIFDDTSRWLDIYFSGKEPDFTPKILITGTPFRKSVAEIMLTIPYGKTMTYGEIANVIAKEKGIAKMSAQAVGGAVGHNSISIIIPCHRVVGTNGSLTGYAGGLDKKIQLLKLEKTDTSGLFVSKKGTVL